MNVVMMMHVLLYKNTKDNFPTGGLLLRVYFPVFTRQYVNLVVFQVFLCSLKEKWYLTLTYKRTFWRWFREMQHCPVIGLPLI
jgi:hypothetical protein